MHSVISAIDYYLPEQVLSTRDLAEEFPTWSIEKIDRKTGIDTRHIAAGNEYVSDLAVAAASKLFLSGACSAEDIDFLLLCTQSPDYLIPTTACIVQARLGIPTSAGALDYNLGCSGYIYGLGIAEGLISSKQARSILLLTSDTYSKHLDKSDVGCRAIFGDGAAATLIVAEDISSATIGPFIYGTDGRGAENLILRESGMKRSQYKVLRDGEIKSPEAGSPFLRMDGAKIFSFALDIVPKLVTRLLERAAVRLEDIDLFVFHQANAYILDALRESLRIPVDKIQISLAFSGNTVSSTIPIALKEASLNGRLEPGHQVMLIGFGVGLSWGATLVKWSGI